MTMAASFTQWGAEQTNYEPATIHLATLPLYLLLLLVPGLTLLLLKFIL